MQGLSFIHRSLLGSHGRLKTSNCLISSRWILKINGFGVHSLRSATAYESENEQYSSIYDRNYFICHISLFFSRLTAFVLVVITCYFPHISVIILSALSRLIKLQNLAKFCKLRRGIWQHLTRKNGDPVHRRHHCFCLFYWYYNIYLAYTCLFVAEPEKGRHCHSVTDITQFQGHQTTR